MEHILDNPIYNALKTGNKHLAVDKGQVNCFRRDIAPFAGLPNYSDDDLKALNALGASINPFVIFSAQQIQMPANWKIVRQFEMLQMLYEGEVPGALAVPITKLDKGNVPEMVALTQLTKPGPFLQRTIEFGNYIGIFEDGKLVSMAGQRMQPCPYVELSAVCTHPGYLGRGYAGMLLKEQVRLVSNAGNLPFLHVLTDNHAAINVYKRIGFKTRKPIFGYVCNI